MGVMGKMGLMGLMNSRRKLSSILPSLGEAFYFTITSKAPGKVRVIPSGPTATTRVI